MNKKINENYIIVIFILVVLIGLGLFIYSTTNDNSNSSIPVLEKEVSAEEALKIEIAEFEAQLELVLAAQAAGNLDAVTSTVDSTSTIPEAGQELSIEDSGVIKSNFLNSPTTLLIILSLLTLISISISFWLYYWRKLSIAGKEIMVPETFEKNIESLNKSAIEGSSIIQNALDNQTAALKSSSKRSDDSNDEIARISEVIAHLQNSLEKKEEEMERFKKGYDAEIYHQFLLRFTRVDKVIKEYIDEGAIDLKGLEDIQIEMVEALLGCKVEAFSPEIGISYKSQDNIEDNPKRIPTTDQNQHETVAEVSQMGYLRRCEDSSIEIISKAKVKVYDYAEPEKNDKSNENNNIKE